MYIKNAIQAFIKCLRILRGCMTFIVSATIEYVKIKVNAHNDIINPSENAEKLYNKEHFLKINYHLILAKVNKSIFKKNTKKSI